MQVGGQISRDIILPFSKNSVNISESVSGGSTAETSAAASLNEAVLYLLVQDLVEDFVKH